MNTLSFRAYYQRFETAACQRGAVLERVSNGLSVAFFGGSNVPRLAIMSGVHGDERSGPQAILSWLEKQTPYLFPGPDRGLIVVPLVNDLGWDANCRDWNGIDLNRSFHLPGAPNFLREILNLLVTARPQIFLDLHEDDYIEKPYVFRLEGENDHLSAHLAAALGFQESSWAWEPVWDGSAEVVLRRSGCHNSMTLEVPFDLPLENRVAWNIQAIEWCFSNVK